MSKYKDLNSYHNSLNVAGTEVGESISLQKRMNPRKKMFQDNKHYHTRNQIYIFGSKADDPAQEQNEGQHFMSEYNRTYEESCKKVA